MTNVLTSVRAELDRKCDGLGSLLSDFADRPLADFLRYISMGSGTVAEVTSRSRGYIASAAYKLFENGRYFSHVNVELALDALWRRPVIFTGPHCQLLPEHFTFAGYMTGLATSIAQEEQICWMLPCATLRLQVANRKGPGWFPRTGQVLNVFGLSVQEMKWRRVCSPGRRLSFAEGEPCRQSTRLDALIGDVEGEIATDLFQEANRRLLANSMPDSSSQIIDLDERFAAWVVADHIEFGQSPVRSLFLSDEIAKVYDQSIALLREDSDQRVQRFPTEHLWAVDEGGHLLALKRSGGYLVSASDSRPVVRCSIADLVKGLRLGTLIPSLFLCYFVMGYLPSVNLAGGVRQPFYMQSFLKIWRQLLSQYSVEQAKQHREPMLNAWALNALDPPEDIRARFIDDPLFNLDGWIRAALEAPLAQTSRAFFSIVEHDFLRLSS